MNVKGLIVSAIKSGSGKTIASLCLMKILKDAGFDVIPFKTGPDFIDTSHYQYVTGVEGRNLDTFFMKKDFLYWNIKDAIREVNAKNPFVIIEGAMGLFDGYGEKGTGSTAELAKLINLPVILVVDAKGMAQSVLPLLYGFKSWDKNVKIKGVIFNKVGSESHFNLLKLSIEKLGIKAIGFIKNDEKLTINERHLGIYMGYERSGKIDLAIEEVKKNIDIRTISELAGEINTANFKEINFNKMNKKIYVAKDKAFCFCYKENLRILEMLGDVRFFSPLIDKRLENPDFIYIPGGYPELYLSELSKNVSLMSYLREYVEKGGYLLAECGGLIYLSKHIKINESIYELCNVFPFEVEMDKRFRSLGYVKVETENNPLFGRTYLKGHRFHYSFISKSEKDVVKTYKVIRNGNIEYEGYTYKNAVASYVHIHFGSNMGAIKKMIKNI